MRNISISVIIPSLNQGQFLEKTITSILQQNFSNLQLIIIDGGSTDDTLDIIKKYERHFDHCVTEKDKGQTNALNKGIKLCTGQYIAWMNSDDIYMPNSFKEFAYSAAKNPQYDIYYANKIDIDENDYLLRKVSYARPARGFMQFYSRFRGMTFCNQAAFFKSTVFDTVGHFDENFDIAMDLDFFYRCIIAKMKFHYTNSVWGARRYHDASKTSNKFQHNQKRQADREMFYRKHNMRGGFEHSLQNFICMLWRRFLLLTQ